jgi:hypothetical protein
VSPVRDELSTILRLVSDGTLSPEEAAPIIEALNRAPDGGTPSGLQLGGHPEHGPTDSTGDAGASGAGRQMRIRVLEHGRQVVNMRIPLAFADMALRMVPGITSDRGEQIRQAIRAHVTGPIVDVEDEDGDGVLITVE